MKRKGPAKRGKSKPARTPQKGKKRDAPFNLQKTAEELRGRSQEPSEANIDILSYSAA